MWPPAGARRGPTHHPLPSDPANRPIRLVGAGFIKSLFQKSPLKSRTVHGATIYDINPPINTQYGRKSRHSRENGNLEVGVPVGFEFMKQALQTRPGAGRGNLPPAGRSPPHGKAPSPDLIRNPRAPANQASGCGRKLTAARLMNSTSGTATSTTAAAARKGRPTKPSSRSASIPLPAAPTTTPREYTA